MIHIRKSNSSRIHQTNKTMPAIIPNWSELKSSNSIIRRRSHHISVVYKNNLYVYGGYQPNFGIIGDMMRFGKDQQWKKQWSYYIDADYNNKNIGNISNNNIVSISMSKKNSNNGQDINFQNNNQSSLKNNVSNKDNIISNQNLNQGNTLESTPNNNNHKGLASTQLKNNVKVNFNNDTDINIKKSCSFLVQKNKNNEGQTLKGGAIGTTAGNSNNNNNKSKFTISKSNFKIQNMILRQRGKDNQQNDNNNLIINELNPGPSPRHCHSAVVYKDKMFVFGGLVKPLQNSNQLWSWDFIKKKWYFYSNQQQQLQGQIINKGPPCLDSHKAQLFGNKMIIYGGFSQGKFLGDIWSLDLDQMKWQKLFDYNETLSKQTQQQQQEVQNSKTNQKTNKKNKSKKLPQPRSNCSLNLFKNSLYIFGGTNMKKKFNDLWKFNLQNKQFTKIKCKNVPIARSHHSSVIYQNYLIVFGGLKEKSHQLNDMVYLRLNCEEEKELKSVGQQQKIQNINVNNNIEQNAPQKKYNKWKTIWADTQSQLINYTLSKQPHLNFLRRQSKKKPQMPPSNLNQNPIMMPMPIHMAPSKRNFIKNHQKTDSSHQSYQNNDILSSSIRENQNKLNFLPSLLGNGTNNKNSSSSRNNQSSFSRISQTKNKNLLHNYPHMKSMKYRTPLKDVNYYNNNIPSIIQRQKNKRVNIGKNLICNLLKITSQGSQKSHLQQGSKWGFSSSLQNLTNSMMLTVSQAVNKASFGQNLYSDFPNAILKFQNPRPRDGHSCSLLENKFMLIFGGDQHMMSYNSLIIVDLQNLIQTTIDNQDIDINQKEKSKHKNNNKSNNNNNKCQINQQSDSSNSQQSLSNSDGDNSSNCSQQQDEQFSQCQNINTTDFQTINANKNKNNSNANNNKQLQSSSMTTKNKFKNKKKKKISRSSKDIIMIPKENNNNIKNKFNNNKNGNGVLGMNFMSNNNNRHNLSVILDVGNSINLNGLNNNNINNSKIIKSKRSTNVNMMMMSNGLNGNNNNLLSSVVSTGSMYK